MTNEYKAEPWKRGSVRQCNVTQMEYIEYKQTGMIKVKDTPLSRGELDRRAYRKSLSYYDMVYNQKFDWLDECWNF